MMALAGVELETLVSEPDALTTRPHSKNFELPTKVKLQEKREFQCNVTNFGNNLELRDQFSKWINFEPNVNSNQ